MSDIKKARKMLQSLAPKLPAPFGVQLLTIVHAHLFRESPVRKAPVKNTLLTSAMKRHIHQLAAADPHMHQDEIARIVGTNAGRVSEVLNGKR